MKIPENILEKLEAIEAIARAHEEAKLEAERVERERLDRIEQYRQSKMNELEPAAEKIMDWMREFSYGPSGEGRRILNAAGVIDLYVARFWMGEPIPESQITCCALLRLTKENELVYEERHKGGTSRQIVVGNTKSIIDNLHPDFVLGAAKALEDGAVWKRIEDSLL